MAGRNWTLEETHMAFALYLLLEPRQHDKRNESVVALAAALHRTPDAVALKMSNIAAHDLNRIEAGCVGMRHGSKLDGQVWQEYAEGGEDFLAEVVDTLHQTARERELVIPSLSPVYAEYDSTPEGKERITQVKQRVNQQYFRNTLLKVYDGRCCMTGISCPTLLMASHIKPWAICDPATERLSASNGLLLNSLHDRAFDQGLITVTPDYRIRVSSRLRRRQDPRGWLRDFEGMKISLPTAHLPSRDVLQYHNDVVFLR